MKNIEDIKVLVKISDYDPSIGSDQIFETTLDKFMRGFRSSYIEDFASEEDIDNFIDHLKNGKIITFDPFSWECFHSCEIDKNGNLEIDLDLEAFVSPDFDNSLIGLAKALDSAFEQEFIVSRLRYYTYGYGYEDLECLSCHNTGYLLTNQRCDQCLSVLGSPDYFIIKHSVSSRMEPHKGSLYDLPKNDPNQSWYQEPAYDEEDEYYYEAKESIYYSPSVEDSYYLLTDKIAIKVLKSFVFGHKNGLYWDQEIIEENIGADCLEVLKASEQKAEEAPSVFSNVRPQPINFPERSKYYDALFPWVKELIENSDRRDEFKFHLRLAQGHGFRYEDRSEHVIPPEIKTDLISLCGVSKWDDLYDI